MNLKNLFGFNKKKEPSNFLLNENDKKWVEDNLKWLISIYGYPSVHREHFLINKVYFPKSFNTFCVENILLDLNELTLFDTSIIQYEIIEDLRDVHEFPIRIQGGTFETELVISEDGYKIQIAKNLLKRPNRLIFCVVFEFIKILLTEGKIEYDTENDKIEIVFLSGIFLGFGIILIQNIIDIGISVEGFWETKWRSLVAMPEEVMVYGLAAYSKLIDEENPIWKKELPSELRKQFDSAMFYLSNNPISNIESSEFEINELLNQAGNAYENHDLELSIEIYEKILLLNPGIILSADIYNNIGYSYIKLGQYEKSITYFRDALNNDMNYGYAFDNLGYALIQTGQQEEGKKQLDLALQTNNNDVAYTLKNIAVYHFKKGDLHESELHFNQAFEKQTLPVDFLEFHFAELLFAQNKQEQAMEYLKLAVEKREQIAVNFLNNLNSNPN